MGRDGWGNAQGGRWGVGDGAQADGGAQEEAGGDSLGVGDPAGEAIASGVNAAGSTDVAGGTGGPGDADGAQPSDLEMFLASMLSNSTGMTEELLRENGMDAPAKDGERRVVERPLTPEEAQLVAERDAVEAALNDVRTRNHGGKLGTVGRWAELGLAPAHMDDDSFASFVFDCLEAAKNAAAFEGSGLPVDLEIYPDSREVSDAQGAGSDSDVDARQAEAGTGVTRDGSAAGSGRAAADAAIPGAAAGADASGAADAPAEDVDAPVDGTPADAATTGCAAGGGVAACDVSPDVACEGAAGEGADASDGASEDDAPVSPVRTEDEDVEYVEPAALEHVHDPLECDDIRVIEGKGDVYLYSTRRMSDNYAHWAYLAAEGDDALTLVDNARQECRVYPRPLLARALTNPPYNFTLDHVYGVFRQVEESGDYPDIKQCSASNGDVYYYSTDYLSTAQAKALAEWYSVERAQNV